MFSREIVEISSKDLSASINPVGAELRKLKTSVGNDLLWNGEPPFWSGRAPLLFPIVGRLVDDKYTLKGQRYHLQQHGFARNCQFEIVASSKSSTTLRLFWNAYTFAHFPFQFVLNVSYAIDASSLKMEAVVKNIDDAPIPVSFGFHPALRWPLSTGELRSECYIDFEKDEPAPIRRLNKGLLRAESFPTPVIARRLHLTDELFVEDALIFDQICSQRLWFGAPSGLQIQVDFPNTPYLGIWTQPGAGFVCIEPWHGLSDPEKFDGDILDKPGIFIVSPKNEVRWEMTITLSGSPVGSG